MKKTILLCSVFLFTGWFSAAADAGYYSRVFGDMDIDRDDRVSFEEYRFYAPGPIAEVFRDIDRNRDEKIDFFEWIDYQKKLYPSETKGDFKYEGRNATWHVDERGNRFKVPEGRRFGHRHDCRTDPWYDPWYDHPRCGPRHGRHHHYPYRYRLSFGYTFR